MATPSAFLLNQVDLPDEYGIIGHRKGVRGNVLLRGVTSVSDRMMAILANESYDVKSETLCVLSDPSAVVLRINVRHGAESADALRELICRLNDVLSDPSKLDESLHGPLPGALG